MTGGIARAGLAAARDWPAAFLPMNPSLKNIPSPVNDHEQGSATVPVAVIGVPPMTSHVQEISVSSRVFCALVAFGDDAEHCGRDARAPRKCISVNERVTDYEFELRMAGEVSNHRNENRFAGVEADPIDFDLFSHARLLWAALIWARSTSCSVTKPSSLPSAASHTTAIPVGDSISSVCNCRMV